MDPLTNDGSQVLSSGFQDRPPMGPVFRMLWRIAASRWNVGISVLQVLYRKYTAPILTRSNPFPRKLQWRLARELADALLACHEKGVMHRDICCSNISLTEERHVKLMLSDYCTDEPKSTARCVRLVVRPVQSVGAAKRCGFGASPVGAVCIPATPPSAVRHCFF